MNRLQGRKLKLGLVFLSFQVGIIISFTLISAPAIYDNQIVGPYLSWSNDNGIYNLTSTSVTISWRTSSASNGFVEYGKTKDSLTRIDVVGTTIQHNVTLDGLIPNTSYLYRVGQGAISSSFHAFKTFPLVPVSVNFCLWSDTQPPGSEYTRVFSRMRERNPDFLVQSGDLVSTGGSMSQWEAFLDTITPLVSEIAFMPVSGNHEYYGELSNEPENFREVMALPGSESTYAFLVGDILFVGLNTREGSIWSGGHAVDPTELQWANQTLSQYYDEVKWIILYCHYPPFSSNSAANPVKDDIIPLAQRYDVDAVFTGHIHNYERFNVPNEGTGSTTNISYFVMGGGGGHLSSVRDESAQYSEVYNSQHHYLNAMINDSTFNIECWNLENEIIDAWTMEPKNRTDLSSYW
ncbi:hypothetical protein GF325_18035 [Candidatus Bathyarchaeota archaeon]|nr:hypothetical protein [Candidatus Bathyarchaeota archaeon]